MSELPQDGKVPYPGIPTTADGAAAVDTFVASGGGLIIIEGAYQLFAGQASPVLSKSGLALRSGTTVVDPADPIADAVRSIVDGHVVLRRELASRGQYPAVDVLDSTSRVMTDVVPTQHQRDAQAFVATLATYQEAEDLINIGAYVRGSNPRIDYALDKIEAMIAYLKQPVEQRASLEESQAVLEQMFADFQW